MKRRNTPVRPSPNTIWIETPFNMIGGDWFFKFVFKLKSSINKTIRYRYNGKVSRRKKHWYCPTFNAAIKIENRILNLCREKCDIQLYARQFFLGKTDIFTFTLYLDCWFTVFYIREMNFAGRQHIVFQIRF